MTFLVDALDSASWGNESLLGELCMTLRGSLMEPATALLLELAALPAMLTGQMGAAVSERQRCEEKRRGVIAGM